MLQPRIHLLPEYGLNHRPHGSAFIRLLRPLSYPSVSQQLTVSWSLSHPTEKVDAVIVDRLWSPDISTSKAEQLVKHVRKLKARLIYSLDDDFLEIPIQPRIFELRHRKTVEFLLRQADGLLVTTEVLKDRYKQYNPQIVVLPHALDERLLVNKTQVAPLNPLFSRRVVIGYMGTYTHRDDFAMVLPALREICSRYPGIVVIQLIGVSNQKEFDSDLSGLPAYRISMSPAEHEYPLFMPWFTGDVHWDIAISPLRDTPFNQCKSDIKYLDYAAIGAAGVYSRVPAYLKSVLDQETGMLVHNDPEAWITALDSLIANPSLRSTISSNAHKMLYHDRVLSVCASHWVDAVMQLLT